MRIRNPAIKTPKQNVVIEKKLTYTDFAAGVNQSFYTGDTVSHVGTGIFGPAL
jgi:hypothetical protein